MIWKSLSKFENLKIIVKIRNFKNHCQNSKSWTWFKLKIQFRNWRKIPNLRTVKFQYFMGNFKISKFVCSTKCKKKIPGWVWCFKFEILKFRTRIPGAWKKTIECEEENHISFQTHPPHRAPTVHNQRQHRNNQPWDNEPRNNQPGWVLVNQYIQSLTKIQRDTKRNPKIQKVLIRVLWYLLNFRNSKIIDVSVNSKCKISK